MQTLSVNDRVEAIKRHPEEINLFISEYKPFIASCVEKEVHRYVSYGEDDELSIGMLAFLEAIEAFDASKGNFLSFARNVIKRRLIDYYRREKKYSHEQSISEYVNEEGEEIDAGIGESLERYSEKEINDFRRLELEELKQELKHWDISFFDLPEASPKHEKTRKMYIQITQFLLSQPSLLQQVKVRRMLPIAEIEKATAIPRKTVERSRKYIIAVIIIMTGDYQYIRDYIDLGVIA